MNDEAFQNVFIVWLFKEAYDISKKVIFRL